MTEPDNAPDPVLETAPEAPRAPDDVEAGNEDLRTAPGAVFPIGGMGSGTAIPPRIHDPKD